MLHFNVQASSCAWLYLQSFPNSGLSVSPRRSLEVELHVGMRPCPEGHILPFQMSEPLLSPQDGCRTLAFLFIFQAEKQGKAKRDRLLESAFLPLPMFRGITGPHELQGRPGKKEEWFSGRAGVSTTDKPASGPRMWALTLGPRTWGLRQTPDVSKSPIFHILFSYHARYFMHSPQTAL